MTTRFRTATLTSAILALTGFLPIVAVDKTTAMPDKNGPEMAWWRESLKTQNQRLQWWREARFGMFIHWGVYSGLGGTWQGKPVTGYAEHIQRKPYSKTPLLQAGSPDLAISA